MNIRHIAAALLFAALAPPALAEDVVLASTVCGNCADPVLDQRRYTYDALTWCQSEFQPFTGASGIPFTLTADENTPCAAWAAYFAWFPTNDFISFELCGAIGHNGHELDCVGVALNYEIECGFDLDIFGTSFCYPIGVEKIKVQTLAPNGSVDMVMFTALDSGRMIGEPPRTDANSLPYAPGAIGDGLPPNPGPNTVHQPHGSYPMAHFGFECTLPNDRIQ